MPGMRARNWLCGVGLALAVVGGSSTLVACGGAGAKFASIKAGEMPSGEGWPGVYYNPVYGYLHMTETGDGVVGRWQWKDKSHWGELNGTSDGNVVRFTWTEHTYGAIGVSGQSKGSGVFVYKMGEDGKNAELDGQYSLEGTDDVKEWHCVKQTGMKPDLNSISGDNPQDTTPAGQDKWN
jgi:hypothetical protein